MSSPSRRVPVALSIAGSDSSGGAGIQADLKTFSALDVYGATVLTAVTAQNTRGIRAVHIIPPEIVAAQLEAVFDDLDIRAVKLGMLADAATIEVVVASLRRYRPAFVVLDPVLTASSGTRLLAKHAVDGLISDLLPLTDCLTPNLAEAAALLQTTLASNEAAMAEQGRALLDLGPRAVLMKGGHAMADEAVDLLVTRAAIRRFAAPRIASDNLHGTGCTLSAALVAAVVQGASLAAAVEQAKNYLSGAIDTGRQLVYGQGAGPVNHLHRGRSNQSPG
jgi:hydroxymethylpyrimidine/phosphomethylpyrimidine kinase